MARWSGVLEIPLYPNSGTFYRVAASLELSLYSRNLVVPWGNIIFFSGDRVEGTGNPVIERLSDPQAIAEILIAKYGRFHNAYVVEASIFNGPFAVYKDFIPSVDEYGDPKSYNATGFPASTSLLLLLSKFLAEAKTVILGKQKQPYRTECPECSTRCGRKPDTILFGFGKGRLVLNQLITEFSLPEVQSADVLKELDTTGINWLIPITKEYFFDSISDIHYVDVGLITEASYLTNTYVIDRISERLIRRKSGIRFLFHGIYGQWFHESGTWIGKKKNPLIHLLKRTVDSNMGKLYVREKLYFRGELPYLQMRFEILEILDVR